MGPIGNDGDLLAEINVTPFVDVMLVLLIIFMVTAPLMIQGVNVSLPEASSGSLNSDEETLVISIDRDNQVFINDLKVEFGFLKKKLGKIMEGRATKKVYLSADKNVSYGLVVQVMSEIKEAGVEKLGMVTEPIKDKKK